MQRQDFAEGLEKLRQKLIYTMRLGDRMVVYLEKLRCDFINDYTSEAFPSADVMNFEKWRGNDYYMCVVKPDENKDMQGTSGQYSMHDNFQFIILCSYVSDDDVVETMSKIPNCDQFEKIIIRDN